MSTKAWFVLVAAFACGSGCGNSKHAAGVACDSKAVSGLAGKLDKANGLNVDLADAKVQADIDAATKEVVGKKFAFDGCKFKSQGNDMVTFSASNSDAPTIECAMKGGEAGVKDFRDAAMKIGQDKVRLDVTGIVASNGSKYVPRLTMTDCEIATHD